MTMRLDKFTFLTNLAAMNITVTGRSGRMGQSVIAAIEAEAGASVHSTHDSGEDLSAALAGSEAVIDFTLPLLTDELVEKAVASKTPLIIGTTGHSDEQRAAIQEASKTIPIVHASNFSTGVNLLFHLTQKAAAILGNETFDIEVTEMHHRHKVDAPSGTARTLLEILNEETQTSYEDDIAHGRVGLTGARPSKEIGMHTLRGGDVVGDHTVMFAADGERFELTHKASSRMTFASGAVRAALWLRNQKPGLYDMQDVLGLK
jgi:4-hydroxy-tetrahydrodipicolinate reductase